MSTSLDISPSPCPSSSPPPWADPWAHPEYYEGITVRRIIAYFLDVIFLGILGGIAWLILSVFTVITFGLLGPIQALILAALPLLYTIPQIAQPGSSTFGMRLMGIRVLSLTLSPQRGACPTLLQATIQTVGFYGSMILTGLLICLIALFNPRRRTLHDWMAGVVVVRTIPRV